MQQLSTADSVETLSSSSWNSRCTLNRHHRWRRRHGASLLLPIWTGMMQLYRAVLGDITTSHDELRLRFQLLDVYVELRRIHNRTDALESAMVNCL
jgi:hypothetical protein